MRLTSKSSVDKQFGGTNMINRAVYNLNNLFNFFGLKIEIAKKLGLLKKNCLLLFPYMYASELLRFQMS